MKRLTPLFVAVVVVLTAFPASAATQDVSMVSGNKFDLATKTVNRGDKVMWTNKSFEGHTTVNAYWASPTVAPNKTFTEPLALSAGTYAYKCTIHFGMAGTIKVPLGATKSLRKITLALNTVAAPTGYKYVVQRKVGSNFQPLVSVTTPTHVFNATAAGTYVFRAALQKGNTAPQATSFSAPVSIAVS